MNTKKIKELVDLMSANDLTEIEIEQEGTKIRLIKKAQGIIEHVQAPVIHPQVAPVQVAGQAPAAEAPKEQNSNYKEIKSPMVGTFYSAASPDADPFVKVGDSIKKGDVLCIVEAMKLMNEVKSEISGKVVEILAENAEPVEFGQVMFLVDPS